MKNMLFSGSMSDRVLSWLALHATMNITLLRAEREVWPILAVAVCAYLTRHGQESQDIFDGLIRSET